MWTVILNGDTIYHGTDEAKARLIYKIAVTENYGKHFVLIELIHNGRLVASA